MSTSAPKTKTAEKSSRLTAAQIKELDIARRADGSSDDWVELYLAEFPENERRDVGQLRALLKSGKLVLHETRGKDGKLLTWSMSQNYESANVDEPSFWLGCWTVTRRDMQSSGVGRVHFARVIENLKNEKPNYIGRITEIEATDGQAADSQPVRRARFYKALGLKQIDVPYQFPLFQPVNAKEYIQQEKLGDGNGIPAQLLIAPFSAKPLSPAQVRSIVKRIYIYGYHVQASDPYIAKRLALVDTSKPDLSSEIKIDGK